MRKGNCQLNDPGLAEGKDGSDEVGTPKRRKVRAQGKAGNSGFLTPIA